MADSANNLKQITESQLDKEVTANGLFDAHSPASLFGRKDDSAGLTWQFYGGKMMVDGVLTTVANGSVTLTNTGSAHTEYIEADRSGTVTRNTTGFTAGRIPLYEVSVSAAGLVTAYTDRRMPWWPLLTGRLVKAMANANQTLTAAEARCQILECTGALTALRNLVVPLGVQQWTVFANVTGGFGVQVIGATGTGITVADGKRAIVYSDGTNVVRVTPDT